MAGNTFGKIFRITTFGESHGAALGVIVDGCPAGLPLSEETIQPYMDRRKPGQNARTTQRKEEDRIEILSGVFEGRTTGTPIAMMVRNADQKSRDYSAIADVFRPGHADFGFYAKYGFRDYRGGGRSSARETLARVAGGAIAAELLRGLGITVEAQCTAMGGVEIGWCPEPSDPEWCQRRLRAEQRIMELRSEEDSAGGMVECRVTGMPAGVGEPVFDKLDARLAQAIMSIGAVKGVEIGDGFRVTGALGSGNNDGFIAEMTVTPDRMATATDTDHADESSVTAAGQAFRKRTNHAGGILGGLSDGDTIVLRAAFKPTPSIAKPQETANEKGENVSIAIRGRHDPTVVERAVVVVECMTALTIADALLENMTSRIEYLHQVYRS